MQASQKIYYKTDEEIELIRHSCLLVGLAHAEVAKYLKPGVNTMTLDKIAEEFICDHNATPAFKGYQNFPATLCISINEQVVHGIPGKLELKCGDIVSIDCGVKCNGFFGDSAYTYCIGEVDEQRRKLLLVTKASLHKGIEQALNGARLGDISFAIQQHVETNGFSVVRELVGHGIGRQLHEAPEVPNYGKRGHGVKLLDGLVLAIEPMVNMGKRQVKHLSDGWTVVTLDNKPSAHFEHTIVIRKKEAEILSTFAFIEESVKNNAELGELN